MKVKTSNIEKAISIALTAHNGQKDRAGAPYILHPLRVMLAMATDLEKQAAVLHDVIEDGGITPENLRLEGFSEEVCSAVVALTKKPGEPYNQYLNRVNENPIARKVKMADLNDNMNLSRIKEPSQQDRKRMEKYKDAMAFLKEKSSR